MMQRGNSLTHKQYDLPKGETEEKLTNIFRKLLNIEHISRHDNFFALGGDSSSVIQLLAELRKTDLDVAVQEVFTAPTLAILASKLTTYEVVIIPPNAILKESTEITPEMLPLIKLSQTDIDSIVEQVPGGVANIQDIYRLTPFQDGILYNHLMTKKDDPHLIASRMRFSDRTSLERYACAVQRMIERHDILRTAIFWDGLNEPAQVVLRQVPSLLSEITFDESDNPVLEQLTHKFHPRHFRLDLMKAPLLHLVSALESEKSWSAIQLTHHLIMDDLAMDILRAETYAIMNGKSETLATPVPFRHLVAQTLRGTSVTEHTRFFTEMFGDVDEPTLPFGLCHVDQDESEMNDANSKLSQTLNDQLRAQAQNLQVSLASLCHLAWAQVLARASERETVVFGIVLLGRAQSEEENNIVMGPTTNTLPIRLNIDERSVESAVRDTHDRLYALLAHEHASLVLAKRCNSIPAGLPLFNALLHYHHNIIKTEVTSMLLSGVTFFERMRQTTYPLTLSVRDDDNSLYLSAQIMTPISATRICAYMKQSLESLINVLTHTPQRAVRQLTVIPIEECNLLLHTWNQTMVNHSPVCCLHQFFETKAKRDGQAVAVECDGKTLSYAELNFKANQLANYLVIRGARPDDRIAFCLKRSTAMIVAMLSILKAGCAFVALDPVYSSQRLNNILSDANPIFLLADTTGQKALSDHRVSVIDLDKQLPSDMPIDNPDITKLKLTPANLVYVIYTSGSTGTPKGVIAEHQQITQLFSATTENFAFNHQDKWCMFHSISFAVSFWEIWNALYYGSQLWIAPHNIIRSTEDFYNWICTNGITVLNQTPSAFKMLLQTKNSSILSDRLRYIIFAGEAIDPLVTKEWYEKYGKSGTILINMYGNSETFHATLYRLEDTKNTNSIGRPLPDLSVYVLDSYGQPQLLGAEGEIYISGPRIARGYLNRPELTAERFLFNPFHNHQETRMYRTGDLARYLPDGNLVFLGRADQQIKIRGFRIEVGEIEACLIEHPQVCEAVVQTYGNRSDARLIAYVVADSDQYLAQNLRTYLLNLLPDYMVPAAYVTLLSLPKTPSGKLNRRALPAPDDEAFAHQQYEAPEGEMEQKLADVWHELLSVDRISRLDNFFALGGHSLLAVQVLALLRQIGLDTTIHEVFDAPNLAMLASKLTVYKSLVIPPNLIMKYSSKITPEMLPLITLSQAEIDLIIEQIPGGSLNVQDIYGLTALQDGMLHHNLMAKQGDPYLIVIRMRFSDRTSLERYAGAVHRSIKRHDILRTAIFWDGLSEPAQVVLRQVPSLLSEITFGESDKPVLEQLTYKFHPRRFRLDLTKAPLLRLIAAPNSEGGWVAVRLIHHSINDHATEERLHTEIHSIMNGKIKALETFIPFRNFVAQARLRSRLDGHTRYFTEVLGDINDSTLPFSLGRLQDGAEINEGHLKLSQTLNDRLRVHARDLQISFASICHLAWAQVLAKASGRESVVFGTVLFGRLQTGDFVMGPMINTLPIRLNVDETNVGAALHDTHVRLSALLANECSSLVLAQRCSGVPASLPLFSALLNYRHVHNTGMANTLLPGVCLLNSVGQTSYPLTLSVDDNDYFLNLFAQVVSPISATYICAYMQQSLESLADALTHTPEQQIQKLSVMPPNERTTLLHIWNQTSISHSPVRCLHQLFEAQVACDGQAISVEYSGYNLSYSELNFKANRLAHYLIAQGVKPDDRIAICVERNTEMIVSILGILREQNLLI